MKPVPMAQTMGSAFEKIRFPSPICCYAVIVDEKYIVAQLLLKFKINTVSLEFTHTDWR